MRRLEDAGRAGVRGGARCGVAVAFSLLCQSPRERSGRRGPRGAGARGAARVAAEVRPGVGAADGVFVVELDRFQGPLDLLLHLIREQDIDIFDIPIAQITAQFLAAIENARGLGLDRAGEFLETAAMLIRIKAQMLLPRRAGDAGDQEDPRAELVRRLLEYEHFREAAVRFEAAEQDRRRHHARGFVPPRAEPVEVTELELAWDDVFRAALTVGTRVRQPVDHRIAGRAIPIEEKIDLILHALATLERVEFGRLVAPFGDRLHGVVTLMAGLELARQRALAMRQSEPFAELWFYGRKEAEADAVDPDH
jgi:segregation and condensation protein A